MQSCLSSNYVHISIITPQCAQCRYKGHMLSDVVSFADVGQPGQHDENAFAYSKRIETATTQPAQMGNVLAAMFQPSPGGTVLPSEPAKVQHRNAAVGHCPTKDGRSETARLLSVPLDSGERLPSGHPIQPRWIQQSFSSTIIDETSLTNLSANAKMHTLRGCNWHDHAKVSPF